MHAEHESAFAALEDAMRGEGMTFRPSGPAPGGGLVGGFWISPSAPGSRAEWRA